MNTFYTELELMQLGIKKYGKNVLIGKHVILYHPEKLTLGHDVRIDDFTIISGLVELGNYIHISHFCGLYGGNMGIFMQDFSGLSSKCSLYADSDDYSGLSLTNPMIPKEYQKTAVENKIVLEKHAIIGTTCVVLPGVTLKEGSAVGAMSLCDKDTTPWSINGGIPAKKLKDRKKDLLLLEKDFLRREETV